ncbi:MAG: PD-(D/E)XK nuclease family protein [Oscillospiraceae bacterium]|nr:PD-(D/E)XK nuclease family protein [Oscillospiraceae bacterium]
MSNNKLKIITTLSSEKRREYLISRLTSSDAAVLIVPEQFLFETERLMYTLLGARKIAVTDITGFSKLAADIAKKHGTPKLYADDIVKTVTMYKTLYHIKDAVKSAAVSRLSYDFAKRMLSAVADFKAAAITPDVLQMKRQEIMVESPLASKLTDFIDIYSAYCETLESSFADKLDDNRMAAELINRHDCFGGKEIFLYEFDSFSASQIGLLKALAESARSVEILFRADDNEVNWSVKRIRRQFAAAGCEFSIVDLGGEPFSPAIELYTADNVGDECEFVAAEIRRLITKEGYRCNDIAVLVCGDLDLGIAARLKEAMAEYDIEAYADLPEPIISKPMTRFIISALDATSLDTPEFLSYIRSGFVRVRADLEFYERSGKLVLGKLGKTNKRYEFSKSGGRFTKRLSKRNMDLLERAAFRYALTRREWGSKFPEQNRDLSALEKLRIELTTPVIELREACRDTTGDRITEALCEFLLETMQLQRTVLGLCHGFKFAEHKSIIDEFRQLWDLIIDVFESLHAALSGFPISLGNYTELLRGVFSSVNIAKPPAVLDAVAIGDLERSRWSDIKAAFVLGANSGSFPKSAGIGETQAGGGFSGREIEQLAECGLELYPNLEERYRFERLMVNKALTLPSKKLYISAPLSNAAWEELLPSPVIAEWAEKYSLEIKTTADLPLSLRASAFKAARRIFAEEDVERDIKRDFFAKIASVNNSSFSLPAACIQKETDVTHALSFMTAQKLFKSDRFSPTAIRTMMECRFKYFCKYGLGIDIPVAENEEEPIARERGIIIHYCLDRAVREMYTLNNFGSDLELESFVERCIREYREIKLPFGYAETKRQSYILMGFKAGIVRMLKHIRGELADSGWMPADFEKRVDFPLSADIRLTGIIDRVDRRGDFIRVVDYKSGSKEMDFSSVFHGLDTQMLLYLFSVSGNVLDDSKPASALYLPADGSKTKGILTPNATELEISKNWIAAHNPSGVIVDGNTAKSTNKLRRLSPDSYDRLREYCIKLINAKINKLRRGEIPAIPVAQSKDNCIACEYCDFELTCGGGKGNAKLIKKELIERVIDCSEVDKL